MPRYNKYSYTNSLELIPRLAKYLPANYLSSLEISNISGHILTPSIMQTQKNIIETAINNADNRVLIVAIDIISQLF